LYQEVVSQYEIEWHAYFMDWAV